MIVTISLLATLALLSSASTTASPVPVPVPVAVNTSSCSHLPTAGPISTVAQFPNGTWFENLALRADGTVLGSLYEPTGRLVLISPPGKSAASGSSRGLATEQTVHAFSDTDVGLGGIVELEPDVFYFLTIERGTGITSPRPGTGKVWRVNMTEFHGNAAAHGHQSSSSSSSTPVTLVSNLTESLFVNGATAVEVANGAGKIGRKVIMVADSQRGVVWRVDPRSGTYDVAVSGAALRNTSVAGIGVNGVHARKEGDGHSFLYFTNTDQGLYARLPLDATGRQKKTGDVEILATVPPTDGVDDFAFLPTAAAPNGAILAADPGNRTVYVSGDRAANCSVALAHVNGPTAVKVAESKNGSTTVFVSSDGGLKAYEQPGPVRVGGRLSMFEIKW